MKKATLLAIVLAILIPLGRPASLGTEPVIAIMNVNVVDVTGHPIQSGMTIMFRDRRITGSVKSAQFKAPANARIVDGRGKFLIPGLWDMHVHMAFGDWIPGGKEVALPLFVANGVTGVRDMGGDLDILLKWRAKISNRTLIGPRIVLSGPMLDGPNMSFPSSLASA